jgi:hypothetical protein
MIELEKDRAVHIRQDSVLLPLDQYDALRAFKARAEEKLAQLEKEDAEEDYDGVYHARHGERDAMIKTLRWLLGRGI